MKLSEIVRRVNADPRKLTEYALNPEAPWGRHKAVVFEQVLGFTLDNCAELLRQIEQKALGGDAVFHNQDELGRRYTVDLLIQGTEDRQAIVRTGWFIPHGADEARLATLYVRRRGDG
jgi:filamentous hemagglutinin